MNNVRVRFAPSPTGPLHIGGVRTALYNYLFAKKHKGTFILRIEDTDQTRYVEGAEDYIKESLDWLGLIPEEGPGYGGSFGPYRQSERKDLYGQFARQLVDEGKAYYAFDTPDDLQKMREDMAAKGIHSAKYNYQTRGKMKNSLTLSADEVKSLLEKGENVTIRLKIPQDKTISFDDIVRGEVSFATNELDDKIILKADGMPTYHLANIIDDHLMEITHVIRGEEWLSSTAHHVLMYDFFGWAIPKFAHLPLILKPSGKGKLSKRDGAKFGFPVFPLEWDAKEEGEIYAGFRESGYLPGALLNFIALLGWNPGDDREMFSIDELIDAFSLDKIVKSGARFDVDKSRWFNQQYIIKTPNADLVKMVSPLIRKAGFEADEHFLSQFVELMKERVEMIPDFLTKGIFFFEMPDEIDEKTIRKKYKVEYRAHFDQLIEGIKKMDHFTSSTAETFIKSYIELHGLSYGAILPVLRIGVSGTMKGPGLFEIMELLGKEEVIRRLEKSINRFDQIKNVQNG